MAGEVHNNYFCEASSDSGDDEDREEFLGRKIRPEKAFKLLNSLNERKTMKLPCLRSRRHRKRPKPLAPVDFAKDSSSSSSRTRMEDDCDQSDTFSEVKSSSSFGTSNFLGTASRKDLSAFDLHDDSPVKKDSTKMTHAAPSGNHSTGLNKLHKRPQPPKWRTCSRAENSSMSSLVSTVIRQDREDKAITTVHTPEARLEDQVKVSQHVQSRAEHIGNGKNGVSCDTLDTGVDQPASPSHQKLGEPATQSVFEIESDPDSPMDKSLDASLTSQINDLQRFLAEDALS